jgi:hypothetical protein
MGRSAVQGATGTRPPPTTRPTRSEFPRRASRPGEAQAWSDVSEGDSILAWLKACASPGRQSGQGSGQVWVFMKPRVKWRRGRDSNPSSASRPSRWLTLTSLIVNFLRLETRNRQTQRREGKSNVPGNLATTLRRSSLGGNYLRQAGFVGSQQGHPPNLEPKLGRAYSRPRW